MEAWEYKGLVVLAVDELLQDVQCTVFSENVLPEVCCGVSVGVGRIALATIVTRTVRALIEGQEELSFINLEEEDVHFFLGKEGSMECAYGFGTSTKERGLMPAVNAAIKDLRRSLSEKPEGIIFTVYGDAAARWLV